MCVFRNMIVRSRVFVKSLMNIRTKKQTSFVYQDRKGQPVEKRRSGKSADGVFRQA